MNTADLYQDGLSDSDLFIRKWQLTLTGSGGASWTVSDSEAGSSASGGDSTINETIRIVFRTRQVSVSSRGSMDVIVYNLRIADIKQVQLYNQVELRAGYKTGRYGTIFKGTIIYFKIGREQTLVDTYLMIRAQDGDIPYNMATVMLSHSAGTSLKTVVNAVAKTITDLGATLGKVVGVAEGTLLRARVSVGQSLDVLLNHNQTFIQNATLNIFDPKLDFTIGDTVKYDSLHGLVGMPEATSNGVEFTALINPTLQVRGTVIIDQKDINQFAPGDTSGEDTGGGFGVFGPGIGVQTWFANTAADGRYTVLKVEHEGDSRGKPWYSHVTCWVSGQGPTPGVDPNLLPFFNLGPTAGQLTAGGGIQSAEADLGL